MKNFFTSFYNSLSDPEAYYSFQKEMQLKSLEQIYFNSLAGKGTFRAVVLPEDIGAPDPLTSTSTTQKSIRVRPLDIHDYILPEPCRVSSNNRKKVVSMHPVAFPKSTFPVPGGNIEQPVAVATGMIVNCEFGDGPQGGKLRQLVYTGVIGISTDFDISCFSGATEALQSAFDSGGYNSLGGYNPGQINPPISQTFYDNVEIPNKNQHEKFFEEEMHKDFVPYAKSVIAVAWNKKQIKVKFNSTFRTVGHQKELRDAWDGWIATLPPAKQAKINSLADWVKEGKPGGKPPARGIVVKPATPGSSNHNFGAAIDCNITVGGITYDASKSKAQWESTGWPEIVKSFGLRWGGDWTIYDPVHIDLNISKSVKDKIKSATMKIADKKQAIKEINKINIL